MNKNMLYLILVAVAVCVAALVAKAFIKPGEDKASDDQGHVLTALWKNYYSAEKADLPKKMSEALEAIKKEAKARRYHWDFYDAAVRQVDAEVSRNWKVRDQMNAALAKDIEEYDEPIVTYAYKSTHGFTKLLDYVLANKTRLQAGDNKVFHTRTSGQMNGLLNNYIKDDYEYALWCERMNTGGASKAAEALREYLGNTYPNSAWLEFYALSDRSRSGRENDLKAFVSKYDGKAINLFGKALLLSDRMTNLSINDAGEDEYKALYADIKAAERERLTYKSGVDGKIAGSIDDFKSQMKSLERKEVFISFDDKDIIVTLRNLDNVEVSMTPDVKNGTPIFKNNVKNPRGSFYVLDTVRVPIPKCDDGDYIVKAKNGKIEAEGSYAPKTLSIALRDDSEGTRFYVAEYMTGKPLQKVNLRLSLSGKEVATATDVAIDGFTPLPEEFVKKIKDDAYYYIQASYKDSEGFVRKSKDQSISNFRDYYSNYKGRVEEFCNLFTDKTAYNPGETVKFKAVLYKGNLRESISVLPAGEDVVVRLINAEGKEAGKLSLKTNDFGSVAGEFLLPKGERNGRFNLEVRRGSRNLESKALVVDEFVLPTYDLAFESVDKLYFVGDEVEVKGKVSSYSGHPLDAADVTYEVESWGTQVGEGDVELKPDGSFSLTFLSVKDHYSYNVKVKVKDATGETKEFSRRVYVLDRFNIDATLRNASKGEVSLAVGERGFCFLLSEQTAKVSFVARNNDGQVVPVKINYKLLGADGKALKSGEVDSGEEIELSVPGPGLYTVESFSTVKATDGKVIEAEDKLMFLMVGDEDPAIHAGVENFFKLVGSCSDGSLLDGEDIKVQMGAGSGEVWAIAELFGDQRQLLERRLINLSGKPGQKGSIETLAFEYKSEYPDAIWFSVFYFRNGTQYIFDREFKREKTILNLPLSFTSFEDKAFPGKRYSFTLKSNPGTELVAAIFDKSSETISPNVWRTVRLTEIGASEVYYNALAGSVDKWGGYGDRRLLKTRGMVAMAVEDGAVERNVMMGAPMQAVAVEEAISADMSDSIEGAGQEESLEEVTVRSDFSTALAFEPFLKTDQNGVATLNFNTSDKLSTFVVQVYAHTKEMKNAVIRQEMTVSIPVKVNVVEPGYLYEGDKYTLHATLSSNSESAVSGTVALQSYDGGEYEGVKPFSTLSKKVTIPAGKSIPIEFAVDPKGRDLLGLKVVFADKAKSFSDAVFVTVPVLKAEQTLTEAHSAVLLAGMDKEALINRLRSEFTGTSSVGAEYKEIDIRQMVLDAIPSKVEPSGKDILSLTEAFYVRQVAKKLGAKLETVTTDETLKEKILACRNADGGFGWFEGMKSSPVITAVVLERLAKLRDSGLDDGGINPEASVVYLDRNQFIHSEWPYWCGWLSTAQYVYVRSMFSSVKFDVSRETLSERSEYSKNFKEFKKYIKDYLVPTEKDGRGLQGQILAKARRIKTLVNLVYADGGLDLASAWGIRLSADSKMRKSIVADVASLDEYAVEHRDGGWYYPNAVMPWRGLLESELYAHSLLCDLLSDDRIHATAETSATSDLEARIADGLRIWMMLQKETQHWGDDPAFVDAVNSVLTGGEDVLSTKVILLTKTYSEAFSNIVAAGNGFTIERHFYKEVLGENSTKNLLEIYPGMKLKRGDKIICEYKIWNQENRSFVKLTAPREAAFRPVDQLSGRVGWWYSPIGSYAISPQGYRNVKTDCTEYYFDVYPEENTKVTEEFFITQEGVFTAPVVTIESLYAPHYRANDKFGGELRVIE